MCNEEPCVDKLDAALPVMLWWCRGGMSWTRVLLPRRDLCDNPEAPKNTPRRAQQIGWSSACVGVPQVAALRPGLPNSIPERETNQKGNPQTAVRSAGGLCFCATTETPRVGVRWFSRSACSSAATCAVMAGFDADLSQRPSACPSASAWNSWGWVLLVVLWGLSQHHG